MKYYTLIFSLLIFNVNLYSQTSYKIYLGSLITKTKLKDKGAGLEDISPKHWFSKDLELSVQKKNLSFNLGFSIYSIALNTELEDEFLNSYHADSNYFIKFNSFYNRKEPEKGQANQNYASSYKAIRNKSVSLSVGYKFEYKKFVAIPVVGVGNIFFNDWLYYDVFLKRKNSNYLTSIYYKPKPYKWNPFIFGSLKLEYKFHDFFAFFINSGIRYSKRSIAYNVTESNFFYESKESQTTETYNNIEGFFIYGLICYIELSKKK